jgi:signal transduction histidine kinase
MGELIEDLLELARSGMDIGETEMVELDDLVHGSWQMIDSSEATLTVQDDLVMSIAGDRDRLRELFENLFRNAIEHGGSDVTIKVGPLPDKRGFYVEDTGPGIPEENREDVLEPGYSTAEDGTGFGLAIVKEIAEAHDWEISITNGADGGARFEITGVEIVGE